MDAKKYPWLKNPDREKYHNEMAILQSNLAKKAQEILNDEKLKDYKEMFKAYQLETIEHILSFKEDDPIKYAFKVRQLVDTLRAYRLLISAVEEDAAIPMEVKS